MKQWNIGAPDARFVANMEDVLDLYQQPYDATRPVVCLDEKSKELHADVREPIAPKPGRSARIDSEYERNGTANMFLWTEPLAGRRRVKVTRRRCSIDFADVLREIADEYPQAAKIILVVDNLNIHGPACLYERFAPEQARQLAMRFEFHYTPKHGSWLNIAECELAVLARQCTNRRIAAFETLEHETAQWQAERNSLAIGVDWRFTTCDARIKLRRLYPVTK